MRTTRILHLLTEMFMFLLILLIMILLYYHIKSYTKKEFFDERKRIVEHTSGILDEYLVNRKSLFQKFCSNSSKRESAPLLSSFSEIFSLDRGLKVKSIILKDPQSRLSAGYAYSSGGPADFFRSIDSSECRISRIFKSPENDSFSIYFAANYGGLIFAGRMPLSKLSRFSMFTVSNDYIILFASAGGEVIASSSSSLEISVLPDESEKTITIDREYYIIKKFNSSIDSMIVLLTPVSAVYSTSDIIKKFIVYLAIIIFAFIAVRQMIFFGLIIHPFERFSQVLTDWSIETDPDIQHSFFFRIKEFDSLYNTFFQKTCQVRDSIRELKENKTELENMRLYLKGIIDSMPSIVIAVDMNARVTEWNRAAEQFTGINVKNAEGRPIWHMIPELGKYSDAFYEALSRRELRQFKKQVFTMKEKVYMDITIFPVTGLESVAAAIRIDDITLFEKAEKNLRQAQKMEIVSTLSTGLAHDFNNILGGILGAASIMKKKVSDRTAPTGITEMCARYLDIIETSANRAAGIITRLLALSMRQEVEFRVTDLNIIAGNVESICRNSLDKSIEIRTILSGNASYINADQNQIEQVMLTLCINAAHSMTIMRMADQQQGGRLTIKISSRTGGAELSSVYVEANPAIEYRSFSVADEGVGIETSRLQKIFEPFYSTKANISGSGLGLSMAYNIIRLHGGFIKVESEPGRGSEFTVYLPAVNAEVPVSMDSAENASYHGEGTILVIDDEPVIRELAAEILEDCGYSVITAADGPEAVNVFREKGRSVKLVLLDLTMPGMSGIETLTELLKIDPQLKVLMSSGFVHDESIGKAASSGAAGFIHKPYTMGKLSETVYRLLSMKEQA